jgi:cephalosporin hydroxylase
MVCAKPYRGGPKETSGEQQQPIDAKIRTRTFPMKIILDTARATLTCEEAGQAREMPLYSTPAFEIISREWVRVGWNQKYPYTFSWFGRPVIQMPDDLIRVQEVLYRVQPDVIIETGVAHGGSLVFYASICKAMSKGRIVGIDIEIRPHNRAAIERHEFAGLITLLEGGSTDDAIVKQAHDLVKPGERVLVILDSCHTKEHVMAELEAYSDLVSQGSYIVATDGVMADVYDVPRGKAEWRADNPAAAAIEFAAGHPEFILEQPAWPFNESDLLANVTHWPHAWLRRR